MTDDQCVRPRKKPSQERARATWDAIVEAAARILREHGVDGLNTNAIAEVAGVSVGSLYQYFPNKEAVVAELIELELDADLHNARAMLAQLHAVPISQVIELLFDGMVARAGAAADLHQHLLPLIADVDRHHHVHRRMHELHQELTHFFIARSSELHPRFQEDPDGIDEALWIASRAAEAAINAVKIERHELLASPHFRRILIGTFRAALLP